MKIPRRASSNGAVPREGGYNLVVLMVAITVVNILIAAALPLWSRIIQHDKEEELIFRGLQYAEAIRVFRLRFQRAPVRIEELMEAKPRCIRQLWKDPMTEDGKWRILYEGVQQPPGQLTPQPKGDEKGGEEDGGGKGKGSDDSGKGDSDFPVGAEEASDGSEGTDTGFLSTEKKEQLTIGPIEGVVSKSSKRSAMIWFGQERYDQWQFRWGIVAQPKTFGVPGAEGQPAPQGESVRWLGRPWPKWLGIQSSPALPQPGGLNPPPGGGLGGGAVPRQNPGGEEGGGAFGVPGGLPEAPEEPPKE